MNDVLDNRAEQAFRDTLVQHAADAPAVHVDLPAPRPHSRWRYVGAAAAVVAVGLGSAGAVAVLTGEPTREAKAWPSSELPEPAPGYRWVSARNVAAQVPVDWGYGTAPGTDWCADRGDLYPRPGTLPYVDLGNGGPTLTIACPAPEPRHDDSFGPAPDWLWVPHLRFETSDGSPDRTVTEDGWTVSTRTIDQVRLRLLTDAAHRDVAADVLESARTFTTDQNGCGASSPVQASGFVRPPQPFDVTEVDRVDSISICQYDRGVTSGQPALRASRVITGPAAASLLEGLQEAPVGSVPEGPATSCGGDSPTHHTGMALRLNHGAVTDDIYLYYSCSATTGSDDGTTWRELTRLTCKPLFKAPVLPGLYQGGAVEPCI